MKRSDGSGIQMIRLRDRIEPPNSITVVCAKCPGSLGSSAGTSSNSFTSFINVGLLLHRCRRSQRNRSREHLLALEIASIFTVAHSGLPV